MYLYINVNVYKMNLCVFYRLQQWVTTVYVEDTKDFSKQFSEATTELLHIMKDLSLTLVNCFFF